MRITWSIVRMAMERMKLCEGKTLFASVAEYAAECLPSLSLVFVFLRCLG
jgi:hypothetical protein